MCWESSWKLWEFPAGALEHRQSLPGGVWPLPRGREGLSVTNSQTGAWTGGTNREFPGSQQPRGGKSGMPPWDPFLNRTPNSGPGNCRSFWFSPLRTSLCQPLNPCLVYEGATLHLPCPGWLRSEYPKKTSEFRPSTDVSNIFLLLPILCQHFWAAFREDSNV